MMLYMRKEGNNIANLDIFIRNNLFKFRKR